jgi:predicted cupin superfamily sugar epimerase
MNYQEVVKRLGMIQHIEGGYFKETYRSPLEVNGRSLMSVIYYMLCSDSAIDHWHSNKSDIVHFHIQGSPIRYLVLHLDGRLEEFTLGQELEKGHVMQLTVPGNTWKACYLLEGEYGLIS